MSPKVLYLTHRWSSRFKDVFTTIVLNEVLKVEGRSLSDKKKYHHLTVHERRVTTSSGWSYSGRFSPFGACSDKGGSGKAWGPEEGRGRGKKKKRDDLWALGETEPRGYPSLSGREVREREKRGLDGRVRGAEGEGPNGPPNHILHLRVILGVYILSAMQMWGSEGRYSSLHALQ